MVFGVSISSKLESLFRLWENRLFEEFRMIVGGGNYICWTLRLYEKDIFYSFIGEFIGSKKNNIRC